MSGPPGARADGDEPQYAELYTPPNPLPPGRPGDLIRTEPSRLVLEPSGQLGAIMAAALGESAERLYALARDVVTRWHPADSAPEPALVDDQAIATLAFINGIMLTFVAGQPAVDSADHLDRLIRGVIAGVAGVHDDNS